LAVYSLRAALAALSQPTLMRRERTEEMKNQNITYDELTILMKGTMIFSGFFYKK
jgi:hypothetical protein